jgi:hypothetical protein
LILSAVHDEERRVRFGSVECWRGVAPDVRVLGVIGSEELRQEGDAVRIAHCSEVRRAADIDDCMNAAGVLCQRVVGIVARIFHAEQGGELPASGMAEGSDAMGIDVVLSSVLTQPAHSALHVIELRRPRVLSVFLEEAVVHREGNVAVPREEVTHALHGAFIKAGPAAAVDEDDRRPRCGGGADGFVDIKAQCGIGRRVGDVLLD